MVSVKCNSWIMVSTCQKLMVQLMYNVDSWRDLFLKICIIMHCVNKVKGYFNFHISNLKLLKIK
jgi:hypothetical protein